jgi:hypothetical protein
VENDDPDKQNRIKALIPQVYGSEMSEWVYPCLPVVDNANHPDHVAHLAADVAALLLDHSISISGTTDSNGTPAHTHNFSGGTNVSHSGTGGTLAHPYVPSSDPLDQDGSELGLPAAEHTYHRAVPNVGQTVWIMFVGGDPNFPIWMGVMS